MRWFRVNLNYLSNKLIIPGIHISDYPEGVQRRRKSTRKESRKISQRNLETLNYPRTLLKNFIK